MANAYPSFDLMQGDPTTWGVPQVGRTFVGCNQSGAVVTKQHDGTITVFSAGITPGIHKTAVPLLNVATVTVGTSIWTEVVTLSGIQRTIALTIDLTNITDGGRLWLKLFFPALPAGSIIIINSGLIEVTRLLLDGTFTAAALDFYGDGGAWVLNEFSIPSV